METGAYRKEDPDTSVKAAISLNASRLEGLVHEILRVSGDGLTSHEIAGGLSMNLVTVSPRLRPLVRKGLVRDSGNKRQTPSGRYAII
jgi:predicted transcriptional regulator